MDSKTLFAKTPPVKLFFIAAMPGAVSMLASALYGLLDGLFVGQFVGSTAFAARATSPSVHVHSCRAFSIRASALRSPAPTALYGGLQATRSSTGSGKTARISRMSPHFTAILSSRPFSRTDSRACRSAVCRTVFSR